MAANPAYNISADLDQNNVTTGWTTVADSNGKMTKYHNGVLWTYTPGVNGALASISGTAYGWKAEANASGTGLNSGSETIQYFCNTTPTSMNFATKTITIYLDAAVSIS